jgi:hypothetical protein
MSVMVEPVLVTVSWTVPYRYDAGELLWLTVELGGGVGFLVGFEFSVLESGLYEVTFTSPITCKQLQGFRIET